MTHTMTIASNPRLLLYYGILAGLPGGALALYPQVSQLVGIAALAAALFVDYRLFRFAQPYIRTQVTTNESGITITLAQQEETYLWNEINLAGTCALPRRSKSFLFLYHLTTDRMITIPYEYTNMNALEKTLAEKTPYETFQLESAMDIRKVLHERFHAGRTPTS